MGKHLKKFNEITEYDAFKGGGGVHRTQCIINR